MRNHSGMGAKILVVEDNPDARELLVMVLARAGYEVIEAANGADALHNATTYDPDLILMDLGLPGMQGDEVMSRIRSNPRLASIPIVLTTAFDRNSDIVKRAIKAGADEVLFKPTDFKTVLDVARKFTKQPTNSQTHSPTHISRSGEVMSTARGLLIQIGPAVSLSIVIQAHREWLLYRIRVASRAGRVTTTGFLQHELAQIFRQS